MGSAKVSKTFYECLYHDSQKEKHLHCDYKCNNLKKIFLLRTQISKKSIIGNDYILFLFTGKRTTQIILFLQKIMCKAEDRWRPAKLEDKMSFDDDDNVAIVGERKKQKNKLNVVVPYDGRQEADDSRCGSSSSVRSSSEVTVVSSQLAAEMLTTLLFFVFLFLVVISTIICAVVLVVGGSRQEESTRLTWRPQDVLY